MTMKKVQQLQLGSSSPSFSTFGVVFTRLMAAVVRSSTHNLKVFTSLSVHSLIHALDWHMLLSHRLYVLLV